MNSIAFGIGPLETEFWRVAFLMTRCGAAMAAAPIFGAMGVPPQVRVIVAGAIAVFLAAWTDVAAPADLFSLDGMLTVAGEVLVGLTLGFALQVAFAAPLLGAEVIGGTMGLSMALTTDPSSGAQSGVFAQYFTIMLTLIFLAIGGHLEWLRLVIESYSALPPGETWLGGDVGARMANFGSQIFSFGVLIALPVTLVLLLVQVLTGVLSRSAPSLNLFALGLPMGVMAGLCALILAAPLMFAQLEDVAKLAIENAEGAILR